MARHRASLPTATELRILQVLWNLGSASVESVVTAHPVENRPNYKTTQTLLRIMESKGFVKHRLEGRVFIYEPLVTRETVDRLSVRELLHQNFRGSASGLVMNLLEDGRYDPDELAELENLIRQYRERGNEGGI